ncbi:hypothetical protein, partial [Escherichia coli]|uniref:hypothetical protein n=1 Tax=Escherichia coli TaxID=562 RepID=UPI001BC89D73
MARSAENEAGKRMQSHAPYRCMAFFSKNRRIFGEFYTDAYFHERRSLNNFHRDRVITFEQIAE